MSGELREAAKKLGAKGAPSTEAERLLFEAWMSGHCWEVCGDWNGTTYQSPMESVSVFDPDAMRTRMMWAAWRDRAALAAEAERVSVPVGWQFRYVCGEDGYGPWRFTSDEHDAAMYEGTVCYETRRVYALAATEKEPR